VWLPDRQYQSKPFETSELDPSGAEGLNGARKLQIENTSRWENERNRLMWWV